MGASRKLYKSIGLFFLTCAVLCSAFVFNTINVMSEEERLPDAFWDYNGFYNQAVANKDYYAIIEYAKIHLDIMKNEPVTTFTLGVFTTRTKAIADAYEALGLYEEAVPYFKQYVEYAKLLDYDVVESEAKIVQFTPVFDLYTKTNQSQSFFNAKFEQPVGIRYGTVTESNLRSELKGESAILVYLEYGSTQFEWLIHTFNVARANNLPVELALNVPGLGGQLASIINENESYLKSIADVLKEYSDVPVFFRFGAEVNTWGNTDPEQFKTAFRKVADVIRKYTTNVAMVWCVCAASSWAVDMNDFYPGDSYVDWVGVSLYSVKYFMGKQWAPDENLMEMVFFTGDGADPVLAMAEVVSKYGDRKPIMIAESGVSHYVKTVRGDETPWALTELKKMYTYLPMVYPQIKMMMYFDVPTPQEDNTFEISYNRQMKEEYLKLIQGSAFLQGSSETAYAFKKVESGIIVPKGIIELYGYAHVFKEDSPEVRYYIDGVQVGAVSSIGYEFKLDLRGYETGSVHVLTVDLCGGLVRKDYVLNIVEDIKLSVSGELIQTDVPPVIANNTTLVPVKFITERLGGVVGWDGSTQTVTVNGNGVSIIMTIGNDTAIVNGKTETLVTPPVIIGGRTMVPVRFIAEAFNMKVDWKDATKTVLID